MKAEDIILLIKAGYTKADIDRMETGPAPEYIPEQVEETGPVTDSISTGTDEETPPQSDTGIETVLAEINKLKSAIRKQNIIDKSTDTVTAETADDILASILKR